MGSKLFSYMTHTLTVLACLSTSFADQTLARKVLLKTGTRAERVKTRIVLVFFLVKIVITRKFKSNIKRLVLYLDKNYNIDCQCMN